MEKSLRGLTWFKATYVGGWAGQCAGHVDSWEESLVAESWGSSRCSVVRTSSLGPAGEVLEANSLLSYLDAKMSQLACDKDSKQPS